MPWNRFSYEATNTTSSRFCNEASGPLSGFGVDGHGDTEHFSGRIRALKGPLHDLPKRPKHCPIPPGAKHLLGVVESAHRQDDEASLLVHAERCEHTLAFLERAQRWQDTWNYLRPHFGEGMDGR